MPNDLRVLVCGSRTWPDREIVSIILSGFLEQAMTNFGRLVIIEGCAWGADMMAHHFYDGPCEAPGGGSHASHDHVVHEHYPADWDRYGKRAGFVRNQQMRDQGKPDVVVAFRAEGESKGTDMMIDLAKKKNIPVYIITAP